MKKQTKSRGMLHQALAVRDFFNSLLTLAIRNTNTNTTYSDSDVFVKSCICVIVDKKEELMRCRL